MGRTSRYVDPGFVCVDNVLGGFRVADLMQPLGLQIVLFLTAIRFLAWGVSTYEQDFEDTKRLATTCYVALHPNLRGITGNYFDEDLSIRLWDLSKKMLKPISKEHLSQEDK
ncbi:hypothetical protein ZIOFF_032010 [Zingiber officinale]|uniref:Uncharacterized protein n=1 Tax=Zingiber officinale TaxID=94328 RepID=A0A8J5GUX0_ZINOF|nr:hypothetical protein ZIOFF_035598 [Zingiber officinale]KAG6506683.1 hypothetical protein ZIOFF_032010 [Zingiber officinale]